MLTRREFKRSASMRHSLMGLILPAVVLIATLHVLTAVAVAQEAAGEVKVESDIEVLIKAESDLQLLTSGQFVRDIRDLPYRVEQRLNSILQRDSNSPFRFQIEQDLTSVGEILSKRHLDIAALYLERFRASGSGLKGAQGRLLEVVRKYPRFSQIDEVLLRLAEVSLLDQRPEDAAASLSKLISDYPSSRYLSTAFEKLNEIAVSCRESADKPEPQ